MSHPCGFKLCLGLTTLDSNWWASSIYLNYAELSSESYSTAQVINTSTNIHIAQAWHGAVGRNLSVLICCFCSHGSIWLCSDNPFIIQNCIFQQFSVEFVLLHQVAFMIRIPRAPFPRCSGSVEIKCCAEVSVPLSPKLKWAVQSSVQTAMQLSACDSKPLLTAQITTMCPA